MLVYLGLGCGLRILIRIGRMSRCVELELARIPPKRFVYRRDMDVMAALKSSEKYRSNLCATQSCKQMLMLVIRV